MEIKINVYERDLKTVKKEVIANVIDLPFGFVRKFMTLFNVADLDDSTAILNLIMKCWDDVIFLLDQIFPDMSEEDWDGVKSKDLIDVIKVVLKYAFSEMLGIPVDTKN